MILHFIISLVFSHASKLRQNQRVPFIIRSEIHLPIKVKDLSPLYGNGHRVKIKCLIQLSDRHDPFTVQFERNSNHHSE